MELQVTKTEITDNAGPTPNVLPEVAAGSSPDDSPTGVSTRNALAATAPTAATEAPSEAPSEAKPADEANPAAEAKPAADDGSEWFIIRASYGRERKANEYLTGLQVRTFYPTITVMKVVRERRGPVEQSRLPGLLFAYGTLDRLTPLVQRNPEAPYLSFYSRYYRHDGRCRRDIIRVPQSQMDTLMRICQDEKALVASGVIEQFKTGQRVRIVGGPLKGVEGVVARVKGVQRVGVIVGELFTVATTYMPSYLLEPIADPDSKDSKKSKN